MKKFVLMCALAVLPMGSMAFAEGAAPAASDEELVSKVKAALAADPELKGLDLKVANKHGEITLSGQTEDGDQIYKAAIAAQKVPGVKMVHNDMTPKK